MSVSSFIKGTTPVRKFELERTNFDRREWRSDSMDDGGNKRRRCYSMKKVRQIGTWEGGVDDDEGATRQKAALSLRHAVTALIFLSCSTYLITKMTSLLDFPHEVEIFFLRDRINVLKIKK